MNIHLNCPGCGRFLRVNEQFAGRTVRCPSCGTAYVAPSPREAQAPRGRPPAEGAPAEELYAPCEVCGVLVRVPEDGGPARCPGCRDALRPEAYRLADSAPSEAVFAPPAALTPTHVTPAAEPLPAPPPQAPRPPSHSPAPDGPPCLECGEPMAADAVVCLACGFNRATGQRLKTVSRRLAPHWDTGNFPLVARAVAFGALVAASFLPLLTFPDDPQTPVLLLFIPPTAGVLGGLLLGTLRRVTVTTDPQGTPVVLEKWWILFIPASQSVIDLTAFRTVRLTHREGSLGAAGLLLAVALCFLGGLPAILWRVHLLRQGVFTLDILGRADANGETILEPLTLYHGRSERMARGIGDALEQIAGLRYG